MIHWPAVTAAATCSTRCCPRCDTLPGEKGAPGAWKFRASPFLHQQIFSFHWFWLEQPLEGSAQVAPGEEEGRQGWQGWQGWGTVKSWAWSLQYHLLDWQDESWSWMHPFWNSFLCSFVLSSLSMDKIAMYCNWTSAYVIAYLFKVWRVLFSKSFQNCQIYLHVQIHLQAKRFCVLTQEESHGRVHQGSMARSGSRGSRSAGPQGSEGSEGGSEERWDVGACGTWPSNDQLQTQEIQQMTVAGWWRIAERFDWETIFGRFGT